MDIQYFPCADDKSPATKHWKEFTGPVVSAVKGVIIPPRIVIIDIDRYKNTEAMFQLEKLLNCMPNWQDALLQRTPSGGEHYAFVASRDDLKQGSDLFGITGFDIRVGGKGYICTGHGYQVVGKLGMNRLCWPGALPELPPEIERRLVPDLDAPLLNRTPAAPMTIDEEKARRMLSYVKPDCGREVWRNVGMSLKSMGLSVELYYEWSSGALTGGEVPHNFVHEDVEHQFKSFKPTREGDTSIGPHTLRYYAMQGGYKENWAEVFASGPAAGVGEFKRIADDILKSAAAEPEKIEGIIHEIKAAPLSDIERELAIAVLREEIKAAGMWSPGLKKAIEKHVSVNEKGGVQARPEDFKDLYETLERFNVWGGNLQNPHAEEMLLQADNHDHFRNSKIINAAVFSSRLRRDYEAGVFYVFSGSHWSPLDDQKMERIVWPSLAPAKCSEKHIVSGTLRALSYTAQEMDATINTRVVYFSNCVFDAERNQVYDHNMLNYNTSVISTAYNPAAVAPQWVQFVESLFLGLEDGVERMALLQEIMGYMLFEDNLGIEKCIALSGVSRGGKGVIMKVLMSLLGENGYGVTTFSELYCHKEQSVFARHCRIFDTEAGSPNRKSAREATKFFNKMISGEHVSIKKMYVQAPMQVKLNNKLMICCNELPNLIDDSGATSNRFMILKFDRSFKDAPDRMLVHRLTTPYELEGIAAWCVEGAKRLLSNGGDFTVPASSLEELDSLRDLNQPLMPFIEECLNVGPDQRAHTCDVYAAYRLWAMDNGTVVASQSMLTRGLKQTLESRAKHRKAVKVGDVNKAGFVGIGLKSGAITTPSQRAFAGGTECEK